MASSSSSRPVTLALQGGGSLGAFTWGVLDRLLDVPELCIKAVSGTSAGAMNGAMLVQGLASAGPQGAKRLLKQLWRGIAAGSGALDTDDSDGANARRCVRAIVGWAQRPAPEPSIGVSRARQPLPRSGGGPHAAVCCPAGATRLVPTPHPSPEGG